VRGVRKQKFALAALGLLVMLTVLAVESLTFSLLAFASPSRPGWSSLLLISFTIALPLGVSLLYLVRAMNLIPDAQLWRAFRALMISLLAPFVGVAAGIAAITTGILP